MISSQSSQQNAASQTIAWWGRIDLLWLMFVPLCAALYTLCLSIGPNDFWYHARAGSVLATTGQMPRTNSFSLGVPLETPYFYQSWISEWMFYTLLERGGLSAIVLARALCITTACILVTLAAWRRAQQRMQSTLSARIAAVAALLGFLMAANNVDTRPQMFSVPLFAFWIFILGEWPHLASKQRAAISVILCAAMALWVNTHGAFFTGIIVLGVLACGELVQRFLFHRRFDSVWGAPLSPRALGALIVLFGAVLVAACCNPRGIGIYNYVFMLAGNGASQKYIQEWQPPEFSLAEWTSLVFGLAPIVFGALTWMCIRRNCWRNNMTELLGACGWRFSEISMLAALFVMGVRDRRAIIWFALAFAPIFAGALSTWLAQRRQSTLSPAVPSRGAQMMNAVLALFLLSLIVPVLPRWKPLILPASFQARFAPTPHGAFPIGFETDPPLLLDRSTPVEAAVWLQKNPPRGKLFHDMVYGSYLMWALQNPERPAQTRTWCDPRIELFPDAFWDEYVRISSGPPDAARMLQKQGFSDALLDPKLQRGLLQRLKASPDWKLVPLRGPAVLLRHRSSGD